MESKKYTLIKPNHILKVSGYSRYSGNGYDMPYSYDIDHDIKLIVDECYNALGFTIKIKEVTNDYIIVNITNENNNKNYDLKIDTTNNYYIEKYDNSRGCNDEFISDTKELSISLEYSNTIEIEVLIESLNKNIKTLGQLGLSNINYFSILRQLENIIYQFDHNLNVEGNKKYLKDLDLIKLIIFDINNYYKLCTELIFNCAFKFSMNKQEFNIIHEFIKMSSSNYSYDFEFYPDKLINIYSGVSRKKLFTKEDSLSYLYHTLILALRNKDYYHLNIIVNNLLSILNNLDSNDKISYKLICEYYKKIGYYYLNIYDRFSTLKYYKIASNIAFNNNDIDLSSTYLSDYYVIMSAFPDNLKEEVNIDNLKNVYQEYYKNIEYGLNYRGLKVDEIEFSDSFIKNIPNVLIKVEKKIKEEGDLHIPYQRWNLMKEYLTKYSIIWKSPKEMNPRVMFD